MRARWLAVALATLTLAACGQSHTGLVLSVGDVGSSVSYSRWGYGWVLAVPVDAAGDPQEIPGKHVRTLSEWRQIGAAALVGRDGGFDLAIKPGEYLVCYALQAKDVDALGLGGCDQVTVVPGAMRIYLGMQGVSIEGS
jgi:hypothetical protein